jgi:hypothetical protein
MRNRKRLELIVIIITGIVVVSMIASLFAYSFTN